MPLSRAAVIAALIAALPHCGLAATHVPPGGANQVDGVEGALRQTLFKGEVRMRVTALRPATNADRDAIAPSADKKILVLTETMNNGTHGNFGGVLDYALTDAQGVVVPAESRRVEPNPPPDAPPGAAWHETVSFIVPQESAPTKLVVTQPVKTVSGNTAKAFRIAIDLTTIRRFRMRIQTGCGRRPKRGSQLLRLRAGLD